MTKHEQYNENQSGLVVLIFFNCFARLESMRKLKAEANRREQEWRKLEEEHTHSVTEVKRVTKHCGIMFGAF